MGLLDSIFPPQGGGLLDFLRNNAMNQQMLGSPDQAQYGGPPPAMNAMAQMQPQQAASAPPVQQPPQQQPQQPMIRAAPSSGGLGAGLGGFINNLHTGPLGALIGGIGNAAGLQDPAIAARLEEANQTAAYLRKIGVPDEAILSAVGNGRAPGNTEVLKTLLARYGNQENVRPATAAERKSFGAPDDLPMSIDTRTNKPSYGPAGQKTTVSLNTVANPVLTGVGEQLVKQRDTAQTAARETIPFVHEARQALDEGATTGAFADKKVFLQKVAGLFGLPTEAAANSEVFRAAIGNQVLAHAKALGANPSNADRDYIRDVMGGNISLEEGSIRKLLDITEKMGRKTIQNFNTDAGRLIASKPESYKDIAPLMQLDEPPAYSFQKPAASAAPPAAASSGGGWQNLGNGVKIRAK